MHYQPEESFKRTQRDYTTAFILRVVDDIEKGCYTYKQAQKRYGIQGHSTVLKWLRKHGTLDWSTLKVREMASKDKTPDQRIKELEAALELEKQKNLLLTTVIDIAEKQYGMAIRKKPSPKQPKDSKKKGK